MVCIILSLSSSFCHSLHHSITLHHQGGASSLMYTANNNKKEGKKKIQCVIADGPYSSIKVWFIGSFWNEICEIFGMGFKTHFGIRLRFFYLILWLLWFALSLTLSHSLSSQALSMDLVRKGLVRVPKPIISLFGKVGLKLLRKRILKTAHFDIFQVSCVYVCKRVTERWWERQNDTHHWSSP